MITGNMPCCLCYRQSNEANEIIKFRYPLDVDGEALLVTQYESGWLRHRTERELSYVCPNHGTGGRETDPKTGKGKTPLNLTGF
jgi:hypothetical protein